MATLAVARWIIHPDGRLEIRDTDGLSETFPSLEEARQFAFEQNGIESRTSLLRIAIAYLLRRDATGRNANLIEGKTVEVDISAASMLRVS